MGTVFSPHDFGLEDLALEARVPGLSGRHVVEMVYRPPAILWGLALTGLALLALLALAARPGGREPGAPGR